jgi:hypothetical protein
MRVDGRRSKVARGYDVPTDSSVTPGGKSKRSKQRGVQGVFGVEGTNAHLVASAS